MLSLATCAVIVPVMRRPNAAAPFMASQTDPSVNVYAVTDPDDHDTRQAWAAAGARVLISDRGHTFAQKVNCGYRATSEPWLLFVGDDVRFHPGWLRTATRVAGDQWHVVSTNDLARRDLFLLAVHPLVRRSYIRDVGMSLDGPGWVAHEGYRHWYVDREWSQLALDRGVMTYAPDAVIEHLHPMWGKAKFDDVYRAGQDAAQQDADLFARRVLAGRR